MIHIVAWVFMGRLTLSLILVLPNSRISWGRLLTSLWPGEICTDVISLHHNGPNTTWDHEANLDCAVCYKAYQSAQHCIGRDMERWWFSVAGDEHEHVAGGIDTPGEIHHLSSLALIYSSSLAVFIALMVVPQVPSDKVQIRTNSEGVQMVFGTCPILVEGNEYIFRWWIMIKHKSWTMWY